MYLLNTKKIVGLAALGLAVLGAGIGLASIDRAISRPRHSHMIVGRAFHASLPLPGGRVLVIGGADSVSSSTDTCEIFDPLTDRWSITGSLRYPSNEPVAFCVNRQVYVVEGDDDGQMDSRHDEGSMVQYVVPKGVWKPILGKTPSPKGSFVAMNNGKVMCIGGINRLKSSSEKCQVFDPSTNLWTQTGRLLSDRLRCSAILLPNGEVLAAGGWHYEWKGRSGDIYQASWQSSSEVYDPASGAWSQMAEMSVGRRPKEFDGKADPLVVLTNGNALSVSEDQVQLYDPSKATWRKTGSLLGRCEHAVVLLRDGRVLAVGDNDCEFYDAKVGAWTETGHIPLLQGFRAIVLEDGRVLVSGGGFSEANAEKATSTYSLFDPMTCQWVMSSK